MHLGLLTQERLAFDPIKPLILRGKPSENSSSVFTGTVVINVTKPIKISSITVTFKSIATTYWPEGIGARSTRLSYEKILGEESVKLLDVKPNELVKLPSGVHRFSFAFIVPNSIVETIDDVYGRVKHTIDAKVAGPSLPLLSNWHISKPVLVLRSYMSDSLLTNNSLQDLSRTYEKHLPAADIQLVVERAAFSSGDLFYLKLIMQPQRKRVRLEHMELTVTENRKYHVAEFLANRSDSEQFILPYLTSMKLDEDDKTQYQSNQGDLKPVFLKQGKGIDLNDTISYMIIFATPTCLKNIHHTTYYRDILFRHNLSISMTVSFVEEKIQSESRPGSGYNSNRTSICSLTEESAAAITSTSESRIGEQAAQAMSALTPPPAAFHIKSSNTNTHIRQNNTFHATPQSIVATPLPVSNHTQTDHSNQSTWFSNLRKPVNLQENGKNVIRKRETIRLETPITVFDCRLKEDYGRLPSYSELNIPSRPHPTDDKSSIATAEQDFMLQCIPDSDVQMPSKDLQPQLCPCYFKFRRQMESAAQAQLLAANNDTVHSLERIPSIPPPDYIETIH